MTTTPSPSPVRHFRDLLTWSSKLRYLSWKILRSKRELTVTLRDATRLIVRPSPSHDYGVAYEVFVMDSYTLSALETPIRCIVDVGANVGYSCLFWSRKFPSAQIIAFEPHPVHVEMIKRNLELNQISKRVKVHAAAVGSRPGMAYLTDGGSSSTLRAGTGPGTIQVPVVDFFETIGEQRIDLLKIDIEGGEYGLIEDPRFRDLRVGALVLEWHVTPDHPDGLQWCTERLGDLGFAITSTIVGKNSGVLWGIRAVPHFDHAEARTT